MDNNIQFIKESAPHIRRKDSVNRMMIDVLIALLPLVIYGICISPVETIRNILVPVAVMELCEFLFVLIMNRVPYDGKKHTTGEHFQKGIHAYRLSNAIVPLVSGVIYGLMMPTDMVAGKEYMIWPTLITGAIFGIVIGKLVFGGTGNNIFNPAAVGMLFSKLCFGSNFAYWDNFIDNGNGTMGSVVDAGATSLNFASVSTKTFDFGKYSLLDMFLGRTPGLIGEACRLLVVVGLVYLIIRHTIDWVIPVTVLGVFYVMMLIAGAIISGTSGVNAFYFATYQLLSGGLLFGAVYMATDPVTSPITRPGRVMYGVILAISTVFIRLFASLPEGCIYSILIGNMMTSVIDYPKWASNRFNLKNILWPICTLVFFLLIMVWALCVQYLGK